MRRLANIIWWLGLSAWFGGMLALGAIAAPAIFHTVRKTAATLPAMPPWLNATDQLGGEIFGNVLLHFATLEWIALACLFLGLLWRFNRKRWPSILMLVLLLLLLWLKIDEQFSFYPLVWKLRAEMRAATMPDAALTRSFQTMHDLATTKGHIKLICLFILLILSAWNTVAPRPTPAPSEKESK